MSFGRQKSPRFPNTKSAPAPPLGTYKVPLDHVGVGTPAAGFSKIPRFSSPQRGGAAGVTPPRPRTAPSRPASSRLPSRSGLSASVSASSTPLADRSARPVSRGRPTASPSPLSSAPSPTSSATAEAKRGATQRRPRPASPGKSSSLSPSRGAAPRPTSARPSPRSSVPKDSGVDHGALVRLKGEVKKLEHDCELLKKEQAKLEKRLAQKNSLLEVSNKKLKDKAAAMQKLESTVTVLQKQIDAHDRKERARMNIRAAEEEREKQLRVQLTVIAKENSHLQSRLNEAMHLLVMTTQEKDELRQKLAGFGVPEEQLRSKPPPQRRQSGGRSHDSGENGSVDAAAIGSHSGSMADFEQLEASLQAEADSEA
eukprot:m.53937 g.53937  ORF g.53937 m.53937 type:complete len:369 (-) comp12420_c0_seq1:81-1187(-)